MGLDLCILANYGTMVKCPDYQGVLISAVSRFQGSNCVYTNTNGTMDKCPDYYQGFLQQF